MLQDFKDGRCIICREYIEPKTEATIECCEHKFCFQCIHVQATQNRNYCPLCDKKFNKITKTNRHLRLTGEEVTMVEDKDVL